MVRGSKIDVYTLHKKKNFFSKVVSGKNKGGAGHLLVQKPQSLGQQKFLADGVAGWPETWPGQCFDSSNRPPRRDIHLKR